MNSVRCLPEAAGAAPAPGAADVPGWSRSIPGRVLCAPGTGMGDLTVQTKTAPERGTKTSRSEIVFHKVCFHVRALQKPLHYSWVMHDVGNFTTFSVVLKAKR